jgi:hypothetical protein
VWWFGVVVGLKYNLYWAAVEKMGVEMLCSEWGTNASKV